MSTLKALIAIKATILGAKSLKQHVYNSHFRIKISDTKTRRFGDDIPAKLFI